MQRGVGCEVTCKVTQLERLPGFEPGTPAFQASLLSGSDWTAGGGQGGQNVCVTRKLENALQRDGARSKPLLDMLEKRLF